MTEGLEGGTLSIELVMRGRPALVVGACGECASKVARLVGAGAHVRVVAEGPLDAAIEERGARGEISIARRAFVDADLDGAAVTFVSPDLEELGAKLASRALREGRLVCTLDRPAASTFVNPAVVERSGIKIALSSGGVAPALMRRLREDLEIAFDEPMFGALVRELRDARAALPRGQRKERLTELLAGFRLRVGFAFPAWLRPGDRDPTNDLEKTQK